MKTTCCALLGNSGVSLPLGPWTTVDTTSIFFCSFSVEALASTLAPVAVDHQADNDEEDAAQHGEEHGEENS